ncbi:MAG: hypothetical protein ACYTEW_22400 [Planctomycetota bacterium]
MSIESATFTYEELEANTNIHIATTSFLKASRSRPSGRPQIDSVH